MAEAITVHCPSCQTAFPVDPDKVPDGGVNARCSECSDVFRVDDPAAAPAVETEAAPADVETEDAGPTLDEPAADEEVEREFEGGFGEPGVEEPDEIATEPDLGQPDELDEGPGFGEPAASDDEPGDGGAFVAEAEEAPAEEDMEFETVDYFYGEGEEEEDGGAEAGLELEEAPPAEEDETPKEAAPDLDLPVPDAGEAAAAEPEVEPETPETGDPASEAPAADAGETAPASRPVFGQRSPEEKAERLARVLVSDMITYNPKLYEKAMAKGTLEEDFEKEIEKSWDEYVEQVGEDLATSTPYWRNALNEILAEGDDVF